jgi:hypothetical protein
MEMTENQMGGEVKRTFPRKGYFWVQGDDGVDYFVHHSQILNPDLMIEVQVFDREKNKDEQFTTARLGQRCKFIPTLSAKGPAGERVTLEE